MRKQNWAPESSGSFVQVSSKSVASFVLLWRQQAPLLLQVLTGLSVARFLHAHQKQHSLREYAIPGNAVTGHLSHGAVAHMVTSRLTPDLQPTSKLCCILHPGDVAQQQVLHLAIRPLHGAHSN